MKPTEDPHWAGWTTDLSVVPDIGPYYYWKEEVDKYGPIWVATKKTKEEIERLINKQSSSYRQ
jgi:hypothetical protein